jgi:hypothetical protein
MCYNLGGIWIANARRDGAPFHVVVRRVPKLRFWNLCASDVLAVETELSRVRGEIESMESQRKNLANQVDFATLSATVNEDYKAQLQVMPPSTSTQFRNAAVDGYRSMVDGIVGVAVFLFSYGPSLLFWAVLLFFPVRSLWRKLRRVIAE